MSFFTNSSGQLRSGWRLLIWLAIAAALLAGVQFAVIAILHPADGPFLDPRRLIAGDLMLLFAALIATVTMKRIERRAWRDYYWPTRDFFGPLFWQGLLWGLAAVSLDVGLVAAFGGYHIVGLAATGLPLVKFTALWIVSALLIGTVEEFTFRAYPLRTLADGIGFWPAAAVLSLGFGALHYFTKPYERWEDWLSVSLLALFGCMTVRRTGTLAFIIGWHAAFDWGAMFLWSGRNAGEFAVGRLLSTSWSGSDRLTGGMLGPEASWMMGSVIVVLFVAFAKLYPARQAKAQAAD